MLVFAREKLVFLSVPKTGTTAWQAALEPHASLIIRDPPEIKHAPVFRYNRFFRPMFEKACKTEDMETLAVMREPVSWLGSWYRYRRRPFMEGRPNSTHDMDFDTFVEAYCAENRPGYANVGSQAKFLEPRPNGTKVTYLFRYEDQPKLVAFLEDRLERKIELGRENVSPEMALSLRPETEALLRKTHAADFALYDSIA